MAVDIVIVKLSLIIHMERFWISIMLIQITITGKQGLKISFFIVH